MLIFFNSDRALWRYEHLIFLGTAKVEVFTIRIVFAHLVQNHLYEARSSVAFIISAKIPVFLVDETSKHPIVFRKSQKLCILCQEIINLETLNSQLKKDVENIAEKANIFLCKVVLAVPN